jgi:hypothetical protein
MPNTKTVGSIMILGGVAVFMYVVSISKWLIALDSHDDIGLNLNGTFGGYLILVSLLSVGIGAMKLRGKGNNTLDMVFIILICFVLIPFILGPIFLK